MNAEGMRVVTTSRLVLRPFTLDDVEAYAAIRSKPSVARFISSWNEPAERLREIVSAYLGHFIRHWDEHGYGPWAVIERASGRLIGHNGLRFLPEFRETEILYTLDDTAWGKGYATEGAAAARDYAFTIAGIDRVIALALPQNERSLRVMDRIGMMRAGTAMFRGIEVVRCELRRSAIG